MRLTALLRSIPAVFFLGFALLAMPHGALAAPASPTAHLAGITASEADDGDADGQAAKDKAAKEKAAKKAAKEKAAREKAARENDDDDDDDDDDNDDSDDDEDDRKGRKAAADKSRARIAAILNAPEAKGRDELAKHLAFETDLSPKAAIAALESSARGGGLGERMQGTGPKSLGSGGTDPGGKSSAAQIHTDLVSAFCATSDVTASTPHARLTGGSRAR